MCTNLAGGLEETLKKWRREKRGIVALTLMIENEEGDRPTIEAARTWRSRHGLQSAYVAADPKRVLSPGRVYMTPLFTVVDPRNMRIVDRSEGWRGRHSDALLTLAQKNQP